MEFIKEYSAVSHFPIKVSFSCFFHIKQEYCCLAASDRKLYKKNDNELKIIDMSRRYQKLLYWDNRSEYLAYSYSKPKKEIMVYHLDSNLREFNIQTLLTDCTADIEDMWLDAELQLLYFVFPLSIQKYNLNGDYLGFIMKAPLHTRYKAVCSDGNLLFVAYERQGCAYVAQYDRHGAYQCKFSIGDSFLFGNMEIIHTDANIFLNIYGKKQGCVVVCLELLIGEINCKNEKVNLEEKSEICIEISKGKGIGEVTCFLGCPKE